VTPREPRAKDERILVLAPTGKDSSLVRLLMEREHMAARECRDMPELCREIDQGVGTVILSEEALDESSFSVLLETISHQPPWSEIPVLLVGRQQKHLMAPGMLARMHAAAKTVMVNRPMPSRTLVTLAEEGLRSRRRQYRVLELLEDLEGSHREVRRLNEDLERRVHERTQELESMVQELQTFSYTVSHDLRAPLRTLSSMSQILIEDYAHRTLDDTGLNYLRRIAAGARRMDALIHDLLSYSRLAYAQVTLERIQPAVLLKEIRDLLAEDLRSRGADVALVEPLQALMADRVLLSQVLTNLLSNATKFVAPGVAPRVRVRTEPLDGWVRLWVEDNGIGIPPAGRDRLFRVFERLATDYEGTGIGLAIVEKAMQRMKGKVGVESEEGRGSRFWIELPKA
jgi:signal transduction histidine kinase